MKVGEPLLHDAYLVEATGPTTLATRPTTVRARVHATGLGQDAALAGASADARGDAAAVATPATATEATRAAARMFTKRALLLIADESHRSRSTARASYASGITRSRPRRMGEDRSRLQTGSTANSARYSSPSPRELRLAGRTLAWRPQGLASLRALGLDEEPAVHGRRTLVALTPNRAWDLRCAASRTRSSDPLRRESRDGSRPLVSSRIAWAGQGSNLRPWG